MNPPASEAPSDRRARRGLTAAVGAFAIWGAFPLYLRLLRGVDPLEIIAHRVVWCCAFVLGWLALRGELGLLAAPLRTSSVRRRLLGSALLVSVNWLTFVWAVTAGRTLEASLGYFINPLVNVLLGVVLLSERLTSRQWCAVVLAALGVAWLTLHAGKPPWIALALALSFASYGLIRKLVAVEAVVGLAAETVLLVPFALAYLIFVALGGHAALGRDALTSGLLVFSGVVTAVPLALFAFGARSIPYSTLGLVQYLGPSLQFATGVFVFEEPMVPARLAGFALIWTALGLYVSDVFRVARHARDLERAQGRDRA